MSKYIENSKTVYLGKGRDLQDHSGNVYFRYFVDAFREQYEVAKRDNKRHVITGVIRLLMMDGYTFVKYADKRIEKGGKVNLIGDDDAWEPADEDEIYAKVGHVFRSCRHTPFKYAPGKESTDATERASEHKNAIRAALLKRSMEKFHRLQVRSNMSGLAVHTGPLAMPSVQEIQGSLANGDGAVRSMPFKSPVFSLSTPNSSGVPIDYMRIRGSAHGMNLATDTLFTLATRDKSMSREETNS
jgi:hypothetical protein